METEHDSQLLKGVLGIVLLRLLAERESYGYERDGHVSSRLVASRLGPARKYYRPTESGRALLASRTRAWRALVAIVEPLLAPPVPAKPKEAEAA